MVGYRLSEADKERLLEVFEAWDNGMLMEVVWLIENLIRDRRKCLTMREGRVRGNARMSYKRDYVNYKISL